MFRFAALGVGLIGVGIIIAPRLTVLGGQGTETIMLVGAVMALASAFLRALSQIQIRRLVQTEETAAIVFYFSLTVSTLALMTIPLGWVWPEPRILMFLIMAGVFGGIAQILLTTSYRYAQASALAPFDYVSMIFSIFIGFFVFAEVPTLATLAGAAIVIFAGILIIYRERQLGVTRGKTAQVKTEA